MKKNDTVNEEISLKRKRNFTVEEYIEWNEKWKRVPTKHLTT
jgi:hypothetical protein